MNRYGVRCMVLGADRVVLASGFIKLISLDAFDFRKYSVNYLPKIRATYRLAQVKSIRGIMRTSYIVVRGLHAHGGGANVVSNDHKTKILVLVLIDPSINEPYCQEKGSDS